MKKETFDDNSYIRYTYSIAGDLKKREVYSAGGSLEKTQNFTYDNGHILFKAQGSKFKVRNNKK